MPHRTLLDDLHGTPTVLLLGDEFDDPMKAACARLSAGPEPVDTYVLKVSFTKSPRTTVAEWGQYNEAPPERLVSCSRAKATTNHSRARTRNTSRSITSTPGT